MIVMILNGLWPYTQIIATFSLPRPPPTSANSGSAACWPAVLVNPDQPMPQAPAEIVIPKRTKGGNVLRRTQLQSNHAGDSALHKYLPRLMFNEPWDPCLLLRFQVSLRCFASKFSFNLSPLSLLLFP